MPKSNHEIITQAAARKGFTYDGNNIRTVGEWKELGYSIIKGQKAFLTLRLESSGVNKRLRTFVMFRSDQVRKSKVKSLITV